MSHCEIYQPSYQNFKNAIPYFMDEDDDVFPPPFLSIEEYVETLFPDELLEIPTNNFQEDFDAFDDIPKLLDEIKWSPVDEFHSDFTEITSEKSMDFDEFNDLFNNDMMESFDEFHEIEESSHSREIDWNPDHAMNVCETSMDMTSMNPPLLVLPFEGMVIENQLSLSHLLMAYVEAMENQETDVAEAIAQSMAQKVNPIGGNVVERVLYYMFQHLNMKANHLTQESIKNFYSAFKAMYQIFPYGKLIHFLANSSILQALPSNADIIHLIDFDIGEGLQWGSLMETIKHQGKEIRLTSVKLNEGDEIIPFGWKFEETKRRLLDQARSCGLKLKVEEVGLQDLESGLKKKGVHVKKAWYVFNINVELLHMGRVRSKKDVLEFLRVANKFLQYNKGMITYGDGDARRDITSSCTYGSFLDQKFEHCRALLESMEFNFPNHLREARATLECLFMAPYVSSIEWDRKWEEEKQYCDVRSEVRLQGLEFREASLVEANEMVKGRDSLYGVMMEGGKGNEVVMEWNGVPLVRLSCWRS